MGNEREIELEEATYEPPMEREGGELEARSKAYFLAGEILDAEAHPRMYSLEAEFRESARNRDYKFYVVIGAFLLLLVAATAGIAAFIEQRYRKADLAITEFQDMNLKELLNAARSEEQKLALAEKALSAIRRERDTEFQKLQLAAAAERETILSSDRPKSEKTQAVAAARAREAKSRNEIRGRFETRFTEKQREVAELRRAVANRQNAVREGVSRAESVVNNYERLSRLRLERQKEYYENRIAETILRYNPVFRERALVALTRTAPRRPPEKPAVGTYHSGMARAGISPGAVARLRRDTDDLFALLARMEQIPFTNSSAPAIRTIHAKSADIARDTDSMRLQLASALEGYRYALDYYARIVPESGYIVDARNPRKIRVHMKPVVRLRGGERGVVFRSDTESVGEIRLHADGRTAVLISVASGKEIRPFDRILVQLGSNGRTDEPGESKEGPKTTTKGSPKAGSKEAPK